MKTHTLPLALLWSITAVAAAFGGDDDLKAESPLTRPPGAPDSNAKGEVKIEHKLDKNRHKLWIEAENIDTSLTFEAWMADASGTLTFIGVMPIDDDVDEVEIEFDSKEGPPLPLGASTVEELSGRAVEVRSGGLTYLVGVVPTFGSGSGGGGGGSGGGSDWIKVKQFLVRPPGAPDSNAKGYVEVRRREKDNDQKFKVEAENINPSVGFVVFLETGVGTGAMQNIGAMKQEESDEVELEIETEDGDPLPLGVSDVSELAGRVVEVRDGSGAIYLTGIVPDIGGSTQNQKASTDLTGVGKANLKVTKKTKKGDHRFALKIAKVEGKLPLELWVFDPAQSAFVMVAGVQTKKSGKVEYKRSTKKGQALPLNAATIEALGGLAVEVRTTDGTVRFAGQVPQL